jgi:hypothetical protein
MCQWFGRELSAMAEAMKDPSSKFSALKMLLGPEYCHIDSNFLCLLQQDFNDLLTLADSWLSPLVPRTRYEMHIQAVSKDAGSANGFTRLVPTVAEYNDVDEAAAISSIPADINPDQLRIDEILVQEYAEEQLFEDSADDHESDLVVECLLVADGTTLVSVEINYSSKN